MIRTLSFISILLLPALILTSERASAQDVAEVAPGVAKVLFENDRVRILELRLKPGEKLAMHSHPPSIIECLTTFTMRTTMPDGTVRQGERKAGEIVWRDATVHEEENIGTTDAVARVIEMKDPPPTPAGKGR